MLILTRRIGEKVPIGDDITVVIVDAWGQQVRVRVDQTPTDPNVIAVAAKLGVAAGDLFNLTIRDGGTKKIETFLNLTTKETARRADRVLLAESDLVRVTPSANLPQNSSPSPASGALTDVDVWTDDTKSTPAKSTAATTGVDSDTLAAADYKGSQSGKSGMFRGDAFASVDREDIKKAVKQRDIRLVVATDAACEGLNLQTLGSLINVNLPWNPSRLEQRLGRIKRFGQARRTVDCSAPAGSGRSVLPLR